MSERPTPETDAESGIEMFDENGQSYISQVVDSDFARKLERERDEAREEAAMWALQRDEAKELVYAWESRWKAEVEFAAKVSVKNDEMQKAVNGLCEYLGVSPANTTLLAVEVLRIERELADAREASQLANGWRTKTTKKVHDAASRLLVAINKEMPIGCFSLISSEYYRLQNAIYGRHQNDT